MVLAGIFLMGGALFSHLKLCPHNISFLATCIGVNLQDESLVVSVLSVFLFSKLPLQVQGISATNTILLIT